MLRDQRPLDGLSARQRVAQHRQQAVEQQGALDRFGQVAGEADAGQALGFAAFADRGEQDQRRIVERGVVAHPFSQGLAVDARHQLVDERQPVAVARGAGGTEHVEGGCGIGGGVGAEAPAVEQRLEHFPVRRAVVDDQDARAGQPGERLLAR